MSTQDEPQLDSQVEPESQMTNPEFDEPAAEAPQPDDPAPAEGEDIPGVEPPADAAGEKSKPTDKPKRKREAAPVVVAREPGKSVFPTSRVQKILKADKVC